MYSQTQLLEIAKKLLIFSWYSGKISAWKSEKILKELREIQKNISWNTDSVSKKIKLFLDDIIWDISRGEPINIDTIEHDEYIENFLVSDTLVSCYNKLLVGTDFKSAQERLLGWKEELWEEQAKKIQKNFSENLSKISANDFSKNLLIIQKFELSKPRKYIQHLYKLSLQSWYLDIAEIYLDILSGFDVFILELKKAAIMHIKNKSLESNYMLCNIKKNTLSFSSLDAADGRDPIEYYKVLLSKI